MNHGNGKNNDSRFWARVNEALDELLELEPAQRAAALVRLTAGAPELRSELERLLHADSLAEGVLEKDPASLMSGLVEGGAEPDSPPASVGPYRIERELGRGGMGTVYLASRDDGQFEQTVAIKVIKKGMDTEAITRRFLRERQILARLQHPNIAGLLDGGVTEDGLPYFVMEYVPGLPLTEYAEQQELDEAARVALMESVCEAVLYAQQRLVVHRDLKPSNILVTERGDVKLLDFGIAKVLSDAEEGDFTLTRPGGGLVTPGYAAPEQVLGEPVTTATDVHALGVVLCELLTGEGPAKTGTTEAAGGQAMRLARQIPGDLGTIVSMAVREEPERRYPSAAALRDDLVRWREGRPVNARGDSTGYRLARYVRRHRVGVTAAVLVFLALASGVTGTLWQARNATREAGRAQEVTGFLTSLFEAADPDAALDGELTARDLLAQGAARLDSLDSEPETQLELARMFGSLSVKLGDYEGAVEPYERALVLATELEGPGGITVRRVLNDLGAAHIQMMRLDVGDSLLGRALALWPDLTGEAEVEIYRARLFNDLAVLAARREELETAEQWYRKALEIDRRVTSERSLEVAVNLSNLGVFYGRQDRLEEARAAHEEALSIRGDRLPEGHSLILLSKHNLAFILEQEGDLAGADSLYAEVVTGRRALYPGGHPLLAGSLDARASVKTQLKDYPAAEALLTEALEMQRRILGDDHPNVAGATNDLAIIAYRQQDYLAAARGFAEAFAVFEKSLPATHPTVIVVENNAAGTYLRCGEIDAAASHFLSVLERLRELGPGRYGPLWGKSLYDGGQTLRQVGRLPEAVEYLQLAVARRLTDTGTSEVLLAQTRYALGQVLWESGARQEARAEFIQARDAFLAAEDERADEVSEWLAR